MRKNIAILIQRLAGGGAERVASNLSLYFPSDKYNVHIIVFDDEVRDYSYKGNLINLNTKVTGNPFGKIFNILKRIYRLRNVKRDYHINTTISLLGSANLINILSKRDDKVIVSVRNFLSKSSNGFYGEINNIIVKLLYRKADSIVSVSKAIKNDLIRNYKLEGSKINTIYNPYDIKNIKELSQVAIKDDEKAIFNKYTIITLGSLTNQKGQWHLIRAFKKVNKQIPKSNLVILGKGYLEKYLKQLVVDLGLEKDVFFLGFKRNPFRYIAKSALYVFPSLYEGFPNALCEAMACGIPVISADCKSGPREILAPETNINIESKDIEYGEYGILVPVLDGKQYKYDNKLSKEEEILSRGIISVLRNHDVMTKYSTMSLLGVSRFSVEKVIKEWEDEI